jgi:uncharacterized NAD(P)/FAD-binding protein YdhS
MPQSSAGTIRQMQQDQQLQIKAATITAMKSCAEGIHVQYIDKHSHRAEEFSACLVLNCTGPQGNISRIENQLLQNLLASGRIRPDALRLGLDATPEGAVISENGEISQNLFALGPPMRGILWECVSVPEIRQQTQNLAKMLLQP